MVKVKYLSKQQIELNAEKLLAGFGRSFGVVGQPPIPVEEILETHLELTMEFDDLTSLLGFPDVLGALWAPDRLVGIDESLDPSEYPRKEGRYRYTVGHEIGHWQQHRHYFLSDPNQGEMFPELRKEPSVICRTSQAKDPIEWQADYFSACLLMPSGMVVAAWREQTNLSPYSAYSGTHEYWRSANLKASDAPPSPDLAAAQLARQFQVSKQAMKIRLEELNLLPQAPGPLFSDQGTG
jgi:uncharacterized protein DUF955